MKYPLHFGACVLGFTTLAACAIAPATDVASVSRSMSESMQLNNIGLIYMQRGDNSKAEACFLDALAREPSLAMAHLNLGLVYQNTGKFTAAQQQYSLAMMSDPMEKIEQPVESVPVEFDMRTVGEIAFHKISELPNMFFAQAI